MANDLAALVERLEGAGVHRAYELGKVPAIPTYPYSVLGLDNGTQTNRTADGKAGKVYRFTVQHFGREASSILDLAQMSDKAFDGVALDDIEGEPVATREISTPPYRDPDDRGVLSTLHTYRY